MIQHQLLHTPHGTLYGQLELPEAARNLVFLARSHHTAVDAGISEELARLGHAVFSMDLLTAQESSFPDATQNVPKLTQRLLEVIDFALRNPDLEGLPVGLFAFGDTAPAAIRVAAQRDLLIKAVVLHGGMIDRAGKQSLQLLLAPLLILLEAEDEARLQSCQRAVQYLPANHRTAYVEIPGDSMRLAAEWFEQKMPLADKQ